MKEIIAIMLAGSVGTLCRYGIGKLSNKIMPDASLPYGTLTVNVMGCLIFGIIMQAGLADEAISKTLRLAITVGFLGAFTTFSTFGFETFQFIKEGHLLYAASNAIANMTLGFLAVWGGVTIGKTIFG